MRVFTIGFTKKNATEFFGALEVAGVRRVVDVRLHNTSHLAGFTKLGDLEFFLRRIGGIDYVHVPDLAPTQTILDAYKKHKGSWEAYESEFRELMERRRIEENVPREIIDSGCLLCSENKPHHCHRRLVAEYLLEKWGNLEVTHLGVISKARRPKSKQAGVEHGMVGGQSGEVSVSALSPDSDHRGNADERRDAVRRRPQSE